MIQKSFIQKSGTLFRRILRISLVIILAVTVGLFSFYYWGIYETGVMAGKVLRITQKGVVFKTYEGKLNLEAFGALKGASPIAESFDFSVEKSSKQVIKDLEEVALSGERVNLHFKKRYKKFPWRGDTKYFVTLVERKAD
jgi:hypothetical protein